MVDEERLSLKDLSESASLHLYDLNSGVRRLARLCNKRKAATGLTQVVATVTQQCTAAGSVVRALREQTPQNEQERKQQQQITSEFASLAKELTDLQGRAAALMREQVETPVHESTTDEPTENTSLIQVLDQLDQGSVDLHAQLLEERELEIVEIQRGMTEINAIFSDLGTMIAEQGQQLDTVEDNVTDVATETANANRELTRADNYQRSRGKWTCYFLLFLLFITVVVGLCVT